MSQPNRDPAGALGRRYEISILIGPCTQEEAEGAMRQAHEAVADLGPGTALNFWDEEDGEGGRPGDPVPTVDVI